MTIDKILIAKEEDSITIAKKMKIKVITDSVSDIPKKLVDDLNIRVVPLSVHFGNDVYRDGVDLTSEEFFEKLKNADKLPTTSQVTPGEFIEVFSEELLENEALIVILMSSKMSGTYNAAIKAKEYLENDNIYVLDSKAISFGYGMMVIEAARMTLKGKKIEEIVSRVQYMSENMQYFFVVDTLEYLLKGGRLSKTEAVLGKVLNIKPIITIEDGVLKSLGKVRGRKRAIKWIQNWLDESNIDFSTRNIGLFHATSKENLNELRILIEENYDFKEILESEVGTVVGTHSGPGCIAISFVK